MGSLVMVFGEQIWVNPLTPQVEPLETNEGFMSGSANDNGVNHPSSSQLHFPLIILLELQLCLLQLLRLSAAYPSHPPPGRGPHFHHLRSLQHPSSPGKNDTNHNLLSLSGGFCHTKEDRPAHTSVFKGQPVFLLWYLNTPGVV